MGRGWKISCRKRKWARRNFTALNRYLGIRHPKSSRDHVEFMAWELFSFRGFSFSRSPSPRPSDSFYSFYSFQYPFFIHPAGEYRAGRARGPFHCQFPLPRSIAETTACKRHLKKNTESARISKLRGHFPARISAESHSDASPLGKGTGSSFIKIQITFGAFNYFDLSPGEFPHSIAAF